MKIGFTLVELSIVLVIIGMLTGGLLVAQSMMETSKINRFVRDLGQYEIAISNFKLNYKYYPGDNPYFIPPGRGNGDIGWGGSTDVACSVSYPTLSNAESNQAWYHLSQSKMINTTYVGHSPTSCGGPHHDWYFDASLAGIISPYTVVNSGGWTKMPIEFYPAFPPYGIALAFTLNAKDVIAVESKMGAAQTQVPGVGLYTSGGGCCADNGEGGCDFVSCLSSNALHAYMLYYLSK